MIQQIALVATGFALLILGANGLVDGASSLAKRYRVSDLVIGLTIVSFGTSAPELIVNIIASQEGHSDIVVGNILGSNNFNLYVILGLSGLIFPIRVQTSTAWKEIPISLLVAILLLFLFNGFTFKENPTLNRVEGLILLLLFALFLMYVFQQTKNDAQGTNGQGEEQSSMSGIRISGLIILGLGALIFGGQVVVSNSIELAGALGISQKIIGLTVVAAGTSLPELVTSAVAAYKKNSDIAIGNVVGSNIFNFLLILATSSIIQPIDYNPKFNLDLLIFIGGTAFLFLAMLTGKQRKLDRWEAAILFGFYLVYVSYLVVLEA